jgi:hypothetical protein
MQVVAIPPEMHIDEIDEKEDYRTKVNTSNLPKVREQLKNVKEKLRKLNEKR